MVYLPFHSSEQNLANQSSSRIEQCLTPRTILLVPLAAFESVGTHSGLGCTQLICEAITHHVAKRTGAVYVPCIPYSNSMPRRSFAATAAVDHRTVANGLTELLESWALQGFRRFGVVDGTWAGSGPVAESIRRVTSRDGIEARSLAWQTDSRVRSTIKDWFGDDRSLPPEYALICMASHLQSGMASSTAYPPRHIDQSTYRTWARRGRDPDRFRALFPDALAHTGMPAPDPAKGERLLDAIVERFVGWMADWWRS